MRKVAVLIAFAAALWLAPGAFAAGWCGGGETAAERPDIVTGQQVHAVVAVPSDAGDPFLADAGRLADDVTSMLAWWQGQDSTRIPRFDQASFGTAGCLDISFVRLSGTGASYAAEGASGAFASMAGELSRSASIYKNYLVYYDGPSVEANVCGVGGTRAFGTGPSFAIVLLQGCPGVAIDLVATHELLHALGAVPPGDPHTCPGDTGHVCDSDTDILYPTTSGEPLSSKLLDVNHDDYYGHSGAWPDIQDSPWLHRLDLPEEALGITLNGAGGVRSDLPGVDCTATCTTRWDQGYAVTLTAQPGKATRFVRWSGACKGNVPCVVKLDAPTSVTALFGPVRIPLRVSVAGKGAVRCVPACAKTFPGGNALALRAVAAKGWRFVSWSGGCKGRQLICRPATDFALTVRATFRRKL
ncbi:MAG: InlB B-repeat-containing protein [Gaiellaceae bacterium]